MNRDELRPGQIYQHFKGKLYQILTVAIHTETEEPLVIYKPMYGSKQMFARPLEMFMSEVDHEKYPDVEAKYRFTLIRESEADELLADQNEGMDAEKEEQTPEVAKEASDESAELHLDPMLEKFLDADSYAEKLDLLYRMRNKITEDIIQTVAVSLDLELNSKDLDRCYEDVKNCLVMMEKYECNRLR